MGFSQDKFPGHFPIRVLQNNVIYELENANMQAVEDARRLRDGNFLDPGLGYLIDESPVETPKVNCETCKIYVQETYLASVWAQSYFFLAVHDDIASKYSKGERPHKPDFSKKRVLDAHKLLAWSISLYTKYSKWPAELPNPEFFPKEEKEWIGVVNNIYTKVVTFVLSHELGHLSSQHYSTVEHILKVEPNYWSVDQIAILKEVENEADNFARQYMLQDLESEGDKVVSVFAMLVAYLGILFSLTSVKSLRSLSHPDLDHRILYTLDSVALESQGYREALIMIVCLGLKYFLALKSIETESEEFETAEKMLQVYINKIDNLKNVSN